MNLNLSCLLFVLCCGIVGSTDFVTDFLKQQQEQILKQQKELQSFIQGNLDLAKKQQQQVASAPTASSSSFQTAYQTNYGYRYAVVTQEYPPTGTTVTTTINSNGRPQTIANPNVHIPVNGNGNGNGNGNTNTNTNLITRSVPATSAGGANNGFVQTRGDFGSRVSLANSPNEGFCHNLFQTLVPPAQASNIVYSPASLEMLLAFISTGAAGQTLAELQSTLQLPNGAQNVATTYQRILSSIRAGGDPKVVMANKVYHSPQLELKSSALQSFARDYFDSELEPVNFESPATATQQINDWVSRKTQNRIQNVISPVAIDPRTEAILVNAIYFKAKWVKPFSMSETTTMDFHVTPQFKVPVNMMYNEEVFRYNEFPLLQASVVELPYENTDISMLVILPFENATLGQVERNLNQIDLAAISAALKKESIHLRIPRFSIDFEQDMSQTLQMLGIRHLFSDQADLSVFFKSRKPVTTTKVQHKAHITVNEAGSEAAASSFASFVPLSLPAREILFTADRPFMFAIRNPKAVFFMGHVVSF